jgi:hypothetical protein
VETDLAARRTLPDRAEGATEGGQPTEQPRRRHRHDQRGDGVLPSVEQPATVQPTAVSNASIGASTPINAPVATTAVEVGTARPRGGSIGRSSVTAMAATRKTSW